MSREAGTVSRRPSAGAIALGLWALSALVRLPYLLALELPTFDPWRHLKLISNLRAGHGFTLFADQPYLWYGPLWYRLCAALPESVGPEWPAAVFSSLAAPLIFLAWPRTGSEASRTGALAAGALTALSGPVVAFTVHYGPEAVALALGLAALALTWRLRESASWLFLAGVLLGLSTYLRLNFALWVLVILFLVRPWRGRLAVVLGMALPLAGGWWRNRTIVAENEWIFAWDGLALPRSGFGLLSTLAPQLHSDVQGALRRLHEVIVPLPEWTLSWERIVFVLVGALVLILARRLELLLAGAAFLVYYLVLDASLASNFFRIYLPLFPLFFLAAGWTVDRARQSSLVWAPAAAWMLVFVLAASGAPYFRPQPMIPLSMVTPPAGLVPRGSYLVNSGFFQPEALLFHDPESRYLGMPLRPELFDAFRADYPDYRRILWHDFSVQDELAGHLKSGGWSIEATAVNAHGRRYTILRPPD